MNLIKKLIHQIRIKRVEKIKKQFKHIGDNTDILPGSYFTDLKNIEIGDHVRVGTDGYFNGKGGIKIGSGSRLAPRITIMSSNHNYDSDDMTAIPYDSVTLLEPVIIGENVWIGSNVSIIPGITIGEGVVIGMGSVITKDIPPFLVVGGNPAKVIKQRNVEKYKELKEQDKIHGKIKSKRQ